MMKGYEKLSCVFGPMKSQLKGRIMNCFKLRVSQKSEVSD
jgi:hypothetical protein